MKAFEITETKYQDLTAKLAEANHAKKSVEFTLDVVKRQAQSQRLILHQTEDQLAISKEQIVALKAKLEETEKARDLAE